MTTLALIMDVVGGDALVAVLSVIIVIKSLVAQANINRALLLHAILITKNYFEMVITPCGIIVADQICCLYMCSFYPKILSFNFM